jgi:hypothetical protein
MAGPLKYYDAIAKDNPEFLKALAEVRRIGVHEGWCYHHVRADESVYRQVATGGSPNSERTLRLLGKLIRVNFPSNRDSDPGFD